MTEQQYIRSLLEGLASPEPTCHIGATALEDAIFAKVMSSKFRKLRADDAAVRITRSAIAHAMAHGAPIKVGLLFGGNKLWRFDEAPEVDWAELFSLVYYLRWMKSIAGVWGPGATFEYCSQDISVESLNNVSREESERYTVGFRRMLEWIEPYLPPRVTVTYRRLADEYADRSEYEAELATAKELVLANHAGELPALSAAQKLATELNVRLRPGQAEDPQWREKVELEHLAIFETRSLQPYLHDTTLIPTCPSRMDAVIITGSTRKSIAKFWAAVGALERTGGEYLDVVLTPRQLASARFEWHDVHVEGLHGRNFSRIRVVES